MTACKPHRATVTGILALGFTLLAIALALPGARADWPQPRANPQRTAATAGVSDLTEPVPYWRHYLGGAIGARGVMFMDVDSDTSGEAILVSGGKLVAKERGDALVWQTPVLGISEIVGAHDMNGDGAIELVVRGSKQIFIIEPATGRVLWEEPGDDFGYLGGARIGDLSGDGIADLLVQECGCCRINNGNTGFMYSFARGFDAGAVMQKQWTMGSVRCGGTKSMAILDMNGDGALEATEGWADGIAVVSGRAGTPLAPMVELGPRSSESYCLPVDTDKNGAQELLCLQTNGPADDLRVAHRLYVIEYVPASNTTAARLQVRWDRTVGTTPRRVSLAANPAGDLDRDGTIEVVVSGMIEPDRWMTYVYDAAGGTLLATIPDTHVAGVITTAGGTVIIASQGDDVVGYRFDRRGDTRVSRLWSLAGRRVINEPDWSMAAITHVADTLMTFDKDNDGAVDRLYLAGSGDTGNSAGSELIAYDMTGSAPEPAGVYALGESAAILTAWVTPALPQEPARVLLAPSDGVMQVLDTALEPVARGLRFGGYYPKGDWRNLHVTPVVGDLGAAEDTVVVSDSRGALLRIDAREASLAVPPEVPWSVANTAAPMIVPGLDSGAPGVVCRERAADGSHSVVVLDANGARVRATEVGGQLLSDITPVQLDGDGVMDFIIQWGEPGNLDLHHRAYSGATLDTLWDAAPQYKGTTRFPAGGAIVDWNSDGVGDFVHQYYATQILSGTDGAILDETGDNGFYFMPVVVNVDSDAGSELILQAGFNPVSILDSDLQSLWASSDDDRPYPYGAVVSTCVDGVPRLLEGSLRYPSRLKMTGLGGALMGLSQSLVLAGGRVFADEDSATSAGLFLGQLTSTSVHENLMGDGRAIAVVGSEDGWLYAVDGCTGELAFSVPFSASVGAIAFGDTDGNGKDEIIVAVADGYLYALEQAPVAAPGWVIDIDPPRGLVDEDVDMIGQTTSMTAVWEAVDGADGYEVAVLRAGKSEFMSSPPWQRVGLITQTTITGMNLAYGEEYIFAVRALASDEPSPDAASDGVMVEDAAGYPVGCVCNGTGRDMDSKNLLGLLLLALSCLLWTARPARKNRRGPR